MENLSVNWRKQQKPKSASDSLAFQGSQRERLLANPHANFDSPAKGSDQTSMLARIRPEKIFWIATALAVGWYFDFYRSFLVQWPALLWRPLAYLAVSCFILFAGSFFYLNFYLQYGHGIIITSKNWRGHAPRAVPVATVTSLLAFAALFAAFWPVHRLGCFALIPSLFMGFFAFISIL